MGKHNEFGMEGETFAVEYLLGKGYKIRHRNYRYLKAEIDIIAQKDSVLAIVEVKSRSGRFIDHLAEFVTEGKKRLLVMAADHYVAERELDVDVRFDIITILKVNGILEVEHLEDAFYHF
ncbi:MAG: YraN family protein [Sediminicola sp.]|tara:strand:+ start:49277 stop:49636 length:360 start_codon:yes stop_codon:yes gene_type:complete